MQYSLRYLAWLSISYDFESDNESDYLDQRSPNYGPRATFGPRTDFGLFHFLPPATMIKWFWPSELTGVISMALRLESLETPDLDDRGNKLRTLQDYVDGRTEYVSVGIDLIPESPYGIRLCTPELNEHFNLQILVQKWIKGLHPLRDHGIDLGGKDFTTVDICVRSEGDSYDIAVNRPITIYFCGEPISHPVIYLGVLTPSQIPIVIGEGCSKNGILPES